MRECVDFRLKADIQLQDKIGARVRIRYIIPFNRELIIPDHWDIPFQGGICRVMEEDGYAKALEVVFKQQPLAYAPLAEQVNDGIVSLSIIERDHHLSIVKFQLAEAMAFLQCYFDIGLSTDEIETKYEGETSEEEEQIAIKSMSIGRHKPALPLSFDLFTRAIMAAEKSRSPKFESTLVSTARKALGEQQFINSFRYAFLLIESLFGDGQFKSAGLKTALKDSPDFRTIVDAELKARVPPRQGHKSDTEKLLSSNPSVDNLIDHLVDKRGFYFHGNIKRKDAWKPEDQDAAQSLALVTVGIANRIAQRAAEPMFATEFSERHHQNAINLGAMIVYQIDFKFREPEETFTRKHQVNIKIPGTKVTPRMALAVAQQFLGHFENHYPAAGLEEAVCTIQSSNEKVFAIQFEHKDFDQD